VNEKRGNDWNRRQRSCGGGGPEAEEWGKVEERVEVGEGTHSQSQSGSLEIFRWGKKDVSGCTLIKMALMIG